MRQELEPLLRERLPQLAKLPMYSGSADTLGDALGIPQPLPTTERVPYGIHEVEIERIIATPSAGNWAGIGYTKDGRASSDIIVGRALDMLTGVHDETRPGLPQVSIAVDHHGNYQYLASDGTHRIGGAKLIGRKTMPVRIESFNYLSGDPMAARVEAEQSGPWQQAA